VTSAGKRSAASVPRLSSVTPRGASWVFCSHAHLDHIRGAAELTPREVIAQRDVTRYLADWPGADVLPVTRGLDGDAELQLGPVSVRLARRRSFSSSGSS
jgi:glyoxylase-like metal-dependent hydrolase (beta-lactamase superfamily II)